MAEQTSLLITDNLNDTAVGCIVSQDPQESPLQMAVLRLDFIVSCAATAKVVASDILKKISAKKIEQSNPPTAESRTYTFDKNNDVALDSIELSAFFGGIVTFFSPFKGSRFYKTRKDSNEIDHILEIKQKIQSDVNLSDMFNSFEIMRDKIIAHDDGIHHFRRLMFSYIDKEEEPLYINTIQFKNNFFASHVGSLLFLAERVRVLAETERNLVLVKLRKSIGTEDYKKIRENVGPIVIDFDQIDELMKPLRIKTAVTYTGNDVTIYMVANKPKIVITS